MWETCAKYIVFESLELGKLEISKLGNLGILELFFVGARNTPRKEEPPARECSKSTIELMWEPETQPRKK